MLRFIPVKTIITIACVSAISAAFVGLPRMRAVVSQARTGVQSAIDDQIKDPTLLRQQAMELDDQYPQQIADVRANLIEVDVQIRELQEEQTISSKVVTLTSNDLNELEYTLTRTDQAAIRNAVFSSDVQINFNKRSFTIGEAQTEASRIRQIRSINASKVSDIQSTLDLLLDQRVRLADLLFKLDTEHTELKNNLWGIDQQINAIARNDRLIEILESREQTIASFENRYNQPGSLGNIQSRISSIRAKQEARLASLANQDKQDDYEQRARDAMEDMNNEYKTSPEPTKTNGLRTGTIEIDSQDGSKSENG